MYGTCQVFYITKTTAYSMQSHLLILYAIMQITGHSTREMFDRYNLWFTDGLSKEFGDVFAKVKEFQSWDNEDDLYFPPRVINAIAYRPVRFLILLTYFKLNPLCSRKLAKLRRWS